MQIRIDDPKARDALEKAFRGGPDEGYTRHWFRVKRTGRRRAASIHG